MKSAFPIVMTVELHRDQTLVLARGRMRKHARVFPPACWGSYYDNSGDGKSRGKWAGFRWR
jgi:hypothetical protein